MRSFGSQSKKCGVHAGHGNVRKPEVFFKTPTYTLGGSDYSLARQGGFILRVFLIALFLVRNLNRKIKESCTVLLFVITHAFSYRREDAALFRDSFRLDCSASLLRPSQ